MSNEQVITILMDSVKELKANDREQDKLINKLFVSIGKITVKTTMIISIFSTIGGIIGAILLKFVFKF